MIFSFAPNSYSNDLNQLRDIRKKEIPAGAIPHNGLLVPQNICLSPQT